MSHAAAEPPHPVQIKALSLTQPWASLVAIGAKRIETRSWGTAYRGPLAIHAAQVFPRDCRALRYAEPFCSTLHRAGIRPDDPLPTGAIVAVVLLTECERITRAPPEPERSFGNYAAGRYAWHLAQGRELATPWATRGWLGLWNWVVPAALVGPLGLGEEAGL